MLIDFIDLFSGIGGFRLGLERAGGFRCVWSCDNSKYANQIYIKQWSKANHYSSDIKRVNPEKISNFDLLCAGFPCQAFSHASPQRKGFKDTRGTLFFEICRITAAKRPSLLLLENVKGLLNHDQGRTFTIILQSLEELGYWVEWQVLNSKYFGVPQTRERVYIIGHSRKGDSLPIFPITATEENPPEEIRQWNEVGVYRTTSPTIKAAYGKAWQSPGPLIANAVTDGWLMDTTHHYEPMDRYRIRRLTPIECERLQGFPDQWTEGISDTQRYRVLGNAVTVSVVEFLGELIKSSFTNNHEAKDG